MNKHTMGNRFNQFSLDADERTIEEMVQRTYRFYTPEQERGWGTVAIKVVVLNQEEIGTNTVY